VTPPNPDDDEPKDVISEVIAMAFAAILAGTSSIDLVRRAATKRFGGVRLTVPKLRRERRK
jgi:hypothetical protein